MFVTLMLQTLFRDDFKLLYNWYLQIFVFECLVSLMNSDILCTIQMKMYLVTPS